MGEKGITFEHWRKLHIEELHNYTFSLYIVRMSKRRRKRWSLNVMFTGAKVKLTQIYDLRIY